MRIRGEKLEMLISGKNLMPSMSRFYKTISLVEKANNLFIS